MLEAAGYAVQITDRPVCCGLTWISTGQLDAARRRCAARCAELGPALDAGMPIVGLEPSCTAVFRADAASCCWTTRAPRRSAARCRTLAELLADTDGWTPPGCTAQAWPSRTATTAR